MGIPDYYAVVARRRVRNRDRFKDFGAYGDLDEAALVAAKRWVRRASRSAEGVAILNAENPHGDDAYLLCAFENGKEVVF